MSTRHESGSPAPCRDPQTIGLDEAASYLGLSEAEVRDLVRRKVLFPVHPGYYFNLEVLAAWKSENLTHIVNESPSER